MTTYATAERATIARQLRAVKPLLWDGVGERPRGTSKFICFAVANANPGESTCLTEELIESRLDGAVTLWGWLYDQGVPVEDLTRPRVQAHRHAWVDLLIAEFEA